MAVQASCTAFTQTLRQPRCGCCGVLRYKPAFTGPAIRKGVQAGTTDRFRVHRLLPTMLVLWRPMLPASATSTIQAGRPRNGRPKSIGTSVALPGQGLHQRNQRTPPAARSTLTKRLSYPSNTATDPVMAADDDGGGGVTEQDSEAKELERRLDKTRQCLRWAPQVDLHAAARGDGSGEGREREAKFRVVEVGGTPYVHKESRVCDTFTPDIVGGTIPRVSTNLCRVLSILSSRERTCIPGGKERGEVVSEMVWGDVCGQSLERGASQIVGNRCQGMVEERGRVEVDVEGSRAFGHPGLLLERQDSTDTKIQHNDTYCYPTRLETAPAYYNKSEQNLNGRDPSFPQPNDLPPFQNNWWAPLASRTWMDPVKARSEEPRDSVESLFDPLAGNLALLVVNSTAQATRTDPERTHLREARLPWALNGVPYVWWLFAVRRYIPNTSLRAERGYSQRSLHTGVHRGDGRSKNNKILLKTVQLSMSTVQRCGGVYAHKAASTTAWNHRMSRRTKTSRLTPEVDREEETWAMCARLPRKTLALSAVTCVLAPKLISQQLGSSNGVWFLTQCIIRTLSDTPRDGVVIATWTSKSISPEFQAGDLEAPGWLLGCYQGRGIKGNLWWPLASSCPSLHLEIVWVTEALRAYSLGFMYCAANPYLPSTYSKTAKAALGQCVRTKAWRIVANSTMGSEMAGRALWTPRKIMRYVGLVVECQQGGERYPSPGHEYGMPMMLSTNLYTRYSNKIPLAELPHAVVEAVQGRVIIVAHLEKAGSSVRFTK
ncbi:hypothetical protein FA13DRAFT_1713845 [Coprinellus micaceus]|uniref:Uncharacterized protein n=1 Tax=Coprinellus micaceus TaxID=71717 RepID=A0A4Y7SUQ8_COPMI|nr:hypothetical protein FA13DRAFT_1713845 [Coprinellus micaceus]